MRGSRLGLGFCSKIGVDLVTSRDLEAWIAFLDLLRGEKDMFHIMPVAGLLQVFQILAPLGAEVEAPCGGDHLAGNDL